MINEFVIIWRTPASLFILFIAFLIFFCLLFNAYGIAVPRLSHGRGSMKWQESCSIYVCAIKRLYYLPQDHWWCRVTAWNFNNINSVDKPVGFIKSNEANVLWSDPHAQLGFAFDEEHASTYFTFDLQFNTPGSVQNGKIKREQFYYSNFCGWYHLSSGPNAVTFY